uniref:WGS project CBMI000000000 data, contig CS3069_c000032 n=1 Tax=Fusarium clavum TaxID=2594811 RepID=A0A090ME81_9HYPO|nr:unnamed protein product [Fusarium clavum]
MSEEERELLARISQVAGQINRHKNQQSSPRFPPNSHPAHHRHNSYRHAGSPYPARNNRVGRPPAAHQHRTLHLNNDNSNASRSASSGAETPPGWVSRTDRHRQLINANVYERDTQNRAKAIEQTRQKKINGYRQREKSQFNEFLKHQAAASSAQTNPAGQNELTIQGVQFRVMDGGKKLVKIPGDLAWSRRLINFVKSSQRLAHAPKVPVAATSMIPTRASPAAPVCRSFGFNGYCEKGADCTERHVFECPDFSNTGRCKVKGCKLPHRERASVLRNRANADGEPLGDISSDDEAADSDDVDSDEVAEFIDADSDLSDFEEQKDFLSI